MAELGGGWRGLGLPCDFSLYSDVSALPPLPLLMCAHVHVFSSLCASSSSFVECVTHLLIDSVLILEVKYTAKLLITQGAMVQKKKKHIHVY